MSWIPPQQTLDRFQEIIDKGELIFCKSRWKVRWDGRYFMATKLIYCLFNPTSVWEEGDEIHHINGNCADDHPDNLVKLTHKEHESLHKLGPTILPEELKLIYRFFDSGLTANQVHKRVKGIVGIERLVKLRRKYIMTYMAA
jgi:hypothetical protein